MPVNQMPVNQWIELPVSDGTTMRAYVSRPGSGKYPGLIVLQEAFGLNAHIRDVTERFGREGFCAIAPEILHRTITPGQEFPYGDFEAARPHVNAVTTETAGQDLRACFDWLQSQPNVDGRHISSVGFCLGGRVSFIANSLLPLWRAVSFYGGRIATTLLDRVSLQQGPILFFWGELDTHIPKDQRDTLTAALREHKKDYVNVEISFANHGFFCNDQPAVYRRDASRYAWGLTLDFLKS